MNGTRLLLLLVLAVLCVVAVHKRNHPTPRAIEIPQFVPAPVAEAKPAAAGEQRHLSYSDQVEWERAVALADFSYDASAETVTIKGDIGKGFYDELVHTLDFASWAKRIDISSNGGFLDEAAKAAELIHQKNLAVRVLDHCASACVTVWAGSPHRELQRGATIGVHQGKDAFGDSHALGNNSENWIGRASPQLLALANQTPPNTMAWLDSPRLHALGVSFDDIDATAVADADAASTQANPQ